MQVNTISKSSAFEGKIIIKSPISKTQNHLFSIYKPAIEQRIKDLPFDLLVEQSKSKKSISIAADVKDAVAYRVLKNKQDFFEAANFAIADGMKKSDLYQKSLKVNEMFNYSKSAFISVISGKFKEARFFEKELAKVAVKNFDLYKEIPKISLTGVPLSVVRTAMAKSFQYRIYRAFSKMTPEEKTFLEMKKAYVKELKASGKKIKTVEFVIPRT